MPHRPNIFHWKDFAVKKIAITFTLIILTLTLISQTLWDDKAADIYSRKINYKEGDSIKVLIDEVTSFKYKSNTKALKNYKLNVKGGEMSALFEFLPEADVEESKTAQESDEMEIVNELQARVTAVGENSIAIEGQKSFIFNNRTSTIEIAGEVSFRDIKSNRVYSRDISNQTLRITTLLENPSSIISSADLETVITNPDATTDIKEETNLSDAKKEELLLEYFNKLINVIF